MWPPFQIERPSGGRDDFRPLKLISESIGLGRTYTSWCSRGTHEHFGLHLGLCACVWVCACASVCVCVRVRVRVYTYMYICAHICIIHGYAPKYMFQICVPNIWSCVRPQASAERAWGSPTQSQAVKTVRRCHDAYVGQKELSSVCLQRSWKCTNCTRTPL